MSFMKSLPMVARTKVLQRNITKNWSIKDRTHAMRTSMIFKQYRTIPISFKTHPWYLVFFSSTNRSGENKQLSGQVHNINSERAHLHLLADEDTLAAALNQNNCKNDNTRSYGAVNRSLNKPMCSWNKTMWTREVFKPWGCRCKHSTFRDS
jgi:hypothetical protein